MAKGDLKSEQVEAALLERLARLERRLATTKSEISAVKGLLASHRRSKLRYKGAIRSNSFSRLLIQKLVLDALKKSSPRPVATSTLLELVDANQDDPISPSTFRSHLYRMKQDGLITTAAVRGSYLLPKLNQKI